MKKYYCLLLLTAFCTNAQVLEFADPAFKNVLVNTNCVDINGNNSGDISVDTNNDGEIQLEEAEAVNGLLILNQPLITSLDGIEAFINLQVLGISETAITSFDADMLTNLTTLFCFSNSVLTNINVSGLGQLHTFYANMNNLTSVDVSETIVENIFLEGNNNLTYINMRNGVNSECMIMTAIGYDHTCAIFAMLPALQTVCVDDDEYEYFHFFPYEGQVVTFTTTCPAMEQENFTANAAATYPNPFQAVINITSTETIVAVNIYTITGRLIISEKGKNTINTASLAAGSYIVETVTTGSNSIKNMIKM